MVENYFKTGQIYNEHRLEAEQKQYNRAKKNYANHTWSGFGIGRVAYTFTDSRAVGRDMQSCVTG